MAIVVFRRIAPISVVKWTVIFPVGPPSFPRRRPLSDALSTPAFIETATAVAEPLSSPATTVSVEPEPSSESVARPVTQRERIPTIDVVRGVSLMGILLR